MGYFSNGEEGERYNVEFCSRCIHEPDYDKLVDCPVLMLHAAWNYDQHHDETKRFALEALIPQAKDGLSNEQCTMFREKGKS